MKSITILAALASFPLPSFSLPTNNMLINGMALRHDTIDQRSTLNARGLPHTCSYNGLFKDGQGIWSTSDGDEYIEEAFGPTVHCWNDYFAVDVITYSTPWTQASGDIYCSDTSACSHAVASGTSYCVTTTQENSVSVTASLQVTFEGLFDATFGVSYTHSWSTAQQNCNTATDTDTCTWSDDQCHVIYTQQLYYSSRGYSRSRCTLAGVDTTLCMKDIIVDAPVDGISVGCGSQCA